MFCFFFLRDRLCRRRGALVFLIWHVYGVCALFSFTQPHCLAYTESSHRVSYTDCPYLISSALSVMRFCMAEVKACMFPAESFF